MFFIVFYVIVFSGCLVTSKSLCHSPIYTVRYPAKPATNEMDWTCSMNSTIADCRKDFNSQFWIKFDSFGFSTSNPCKAFVSFSNVRIDIKAAPEILEDDRLLKTVAYLGMCLNSYNPDANSMSYAMKLAADQSATFLNTIKSVIASVEQFLNLRYSDTDDSNLTFSSIVSGLISTLVKVDFWSLKVHEGTQWVLSKLGQNSGHDTGSLDNREIVALMANLEVYVHALKHFSKDAQLGYDAMVRKQMDVEYCNCGFCDSNQNEDLPFYSHSEGTLTYLLDRHNLHYYTDTSGFYGSVSIPGDIMLISDWWGKFVVSVPIRYDLSIPCPNHKMWGIAPNSIIN